MARQVESINKSTVWFGEVYPEREKYSSSLPPPKCFFRLQLVGKPDVCATQNSRLVDPGTSAIPSFDIGWKEQPLTILLASR